jgi:hypothetical protein
VVFVGVAVLALAVGGRQLMLLMYGAAYTKAGMVVLLLLPGMFAISLHLVPDSYFAGNGFPNLLSVGDGGGRVEGARESDTGSAPGIGGAAVSTSFAYSALLASKVVALPE